MVTEREERMPTGTEPRRVHSAAWDLVLAVLHAIRSGWRRLRTWNRRDGAGASGLARLVEVHALQAAGDSTVAVALAGTLFFSSPTNEARTKLALYLLLTLAPFAVVAPLLGPLLDRFRHGRRFALFATMAARAALALVIGHNLASSGQTLVLYPAALGVLISGKAYGIARSAAVPRLLPQRMTLVQANSRLTFAAVIAPALAGSTAIAISKVFDILAALRFGAALYVAAAILALRLPGTADGGGETRAHESSAGRGLLALTNVDAEVGVALRCTAALRWLGGFLLLYGAFLLRTHKLSGLSHNMSLAVLAIGIGVGNLLGVTVGARLADRPTRRLVPPLLAVNVVAAFYVALDFGLLSVVLLALCSAGAAAVAKLHLDATIQQRVADDVRTSTFARSETTLQLAWVFGGAVGILLPTIPLVGFLVAAAVLTAGLANALGWLPRSAHRRAPAGG